MVWTFIILGLLTSAWSLYALIASFVTRQDHRAFHAAAVALLALAWTLGHETGIGRLALVAAIIIECVARFRRGGLSEIPEGEGAKAMDEADKPVAEGAEGATPGGVSQALTADAADGAECTASDVGEPGEFADAASELEQPEPPPPPEPPPALEREPLSSCILLRSPWGAAPSVFHASLRRGGRHDAELLDDEVEDDTLVVRVGDIRLEIRSVAEPSLRSQVNAAARLAWEWPEAPHAVRTYAAHVVFTTIAPEDTPPRDLVHLHHRGQAALAEFTSIIAVFWPAAGHLTSPDALPDLIARPNDAAAMSASCVSFRVFEPQAEGEPYALDTAGLHALGLPDLQAFSYTEPDDTISALLYELAERLFREGDKTIAPDGRIEAADGRMWQAELQWSQREPRRPVLSLRREGDEPAGTEEAAESHNEQQQTERSEIPQSEPDAPPIDETPTDDEPHRAERSEISQEEPDTRPSGPAS